MQFIKDYKHIENYRNSFNELATKVFGINFESWYQKGYWNNRYIPFSFIDEEQVVANVSVNELIFVINGEKKKALQIGTVMTHPEYRNKGLSARLMNKVLDEYEDKYDFIYLFANESVLDFYPKFGFKSVDEYQYSIDLIPSKSGHAAIRKLNCDHDEDLTFIYQYVTNRIPVSKVFGTENTDSIVMFHCMYVFRHDLYYLECEDAIVIFKKNHHQLDVFDIISEKEIDINEILSTIADEDTNKVVFHYTPDYDGVYAEKTIYHGDDVLFVREHGTNHFPLQVKHPLTSQA